MRKIFNRRYLLKKIFWMVSVLIGVIYAHKTAKAKGDNVVDDLEKEEFMSVFDDEQVFFFFTDEIGLSVTFTGQPSYYYIPRERKDFVEQVKNLAAAWKTRKRVKLVVLGSEIISVTQQ